MYKVFDDKKSFCMMNISHNKPCKALTKCVLLEAGRARYLVYALLLQSPCSRRASTSPVAKKPVVAPPLLKLDHPNLVGSNPKAAIADLRTGSANWRLRGLYTPQ